MLDAPTEVVTPFLPGIVLQCRIQVFSFSTVIFVGSALLGIVSASGTKNNKAEPRKIYLMLDFVPFEQINGF